MSVGGYGSIWKSTDYGLKWSMIDCKPNPASLALGHVLAIAGTSPATLWMATGIGDKKLYKSTDAGLTFRLTGTIPIHTEAFYSIVVDPTNAQHLLTGFPKRTGSPSPTMAAKRGTSSTVRVGQVEEHPISRSSWTCKTARRPTRRGSPSLRAALRS